MFSGCAALLPVYLPTDCVFFCGTRQIAVRPSNRNDDVDRLLRHWKARTAAFIIAFNPRSIDVRRSRNLAANRRLAGLLRRAGYPLPFGKCRGPVGDWTPEPSLFALGIGRKCAARVGHLFRQNAIVCVRRGRPAEVLRLR